MKPNTIQSSKKDLTDLWQNSKWWSGSLAWQSLLQTSLSQILSSPQNSCPHLFASAVPVAICAIWGLNISKCSLFWKWTSRGNWSLLFASFHNLLLTFHPVAWYCIWAGLIVWKHSAIIIRPFCLLDTGSNVAQDNHTLASIVDRPLHPTLIRPVWSRQFGWLGHSSLTILSAFCNRITYVTLSYSVLFQVRSCQSGKLTQANSRQCQLFLQLSVLHILIYRHLRWWYLKEFHNAKQSEGTFLGWFLATWICLPQGEIHL